MYPFSSAFAQSLRYPSISSVAVRADAWRGAIQVAPSLKIIGGKITCDTTSTSGWRSGDATVVDPTGALIPTSGASILTPYGTELSLYRGFNLYNGLQEVLPLGVFRVASSTVEDQGERIINLALYDRSYTVSRARVEAPLYIAAGTDFATAIATILTTALPGCPYDFSNTAGIVTPLVVLQEQDNPWQVMTDMAHALGMILYFNVSGTCVMRPEPNPSTDSPVWIYGDNTQSNISHVQVAWDADPGYNEFIVESNNPGQSIIRSVAQDLDPTSPTLYTGPYGHVPEFFSSSFLTAQSQADSAAVGGLLRNKGGTQLVNFNGTTNAGHEGLDVIQVARVRDGLASTVFVLESFDLSLVAGEQMAFNCRKRSAI